MSKITVLPENLTVANTYLETGDLALTAARHDLTQEMVTRALNDPETRRYIDNVYLDSGYRNRFKLGRLLDDLIESKIAEMEDELYTKADLLELLKFANQLRQDELKATNPRQTNVQINDFGGQNYASLMERLMNES